jgi:hypothetical protein
MRPERGALRWAIPGRRKQRPSDDGCCNAFFARDDLYPEPVSEPAPTYPATHFRQPNFGSYPRTFRAFSMANRVS